MHYMLKASNLKLWNKWKNFNIIYKKWQLRLDQAVILESIR